MELLNLQNMGHLRELLLDAEVPISKLIAYRFMSSRKQIIRDVINRNPSILENSLMLANRFQNIIVKSDEPILQIKTDILPVGEVTTFEEAFPELEFLSGGLERLPKVILDYEITCEFIFCRHKGNLTMSAVHTILKSIIDDVKGYYMCPSYATLNHLFRILPSNKEDLIVALDNISKYDFEFLLESLRG